MVVVKNSGLVTAHPFATADFVRYTGTVPPTDPRETPRIAERAPSCEPRERGPIAERAPSFGPHVTWSRPEAFGAWVRFGDSLLLAVDEALAAKLGVPAGRAISADPAPLEVHIAVTSRCNAPCPGCYLDARPDGEDVPFDVLAARLRSARDAGASTVAFGGGEPLLRDDLPRLAEEARALGLVPVLTTSGAGLTNSRAATLRAFAQINVSHDGAGAAYEAVRGYDGAAVAERAIAALATNGIPAGVNFVVTRASIGAVFETAERAADLGASELQLLRYKPAGRAASAVYEAHRLEPSQVDALWPAIGRVVASRRVRVRIDCAMVPLLSPALVAAGVDRVAELGVFGCEAAARLGSVPFDGAPAPCSFLRGIEPNSIRAYHASLPEPCASCALVKVCRGGCQAVSLNATASFSPDPECPRVRMFEGARAREDATTERGGTSVATAPEDPDALHRRLPIVS
ncbi:MAG: radical SAM protein [Polyangiaceae bacterium]